MRYAPPADQLVYDDDPADVPSLRSKDPGLTSGTGGDLFRFSPTWDEFYRHLSPPGRYPAATLFLHQRSTRKGISRLVVVEFPSYHRFADMLCCEVIEPGGLFTWPIEIQKTTFPPDGIGSSVKWYAGQPDPSDESHFVIRGVADGKTPIQADGWLTDEDSVNISVTSPAPSSAAQSR